MTREDAFWNAESAKWAYKRAAMTMLLDAEDAVMTKADFEKLNEYSCSVPSGAPVGKIWKCRRPFRSKPGDASWWLGEYWDDGQIEATGSVPIRWRRIHLVDGYFEAHKFEEAHDDPVPAPKCWFCLEGRDAPVHQEGAQ